MIHLRSLKSVDADVANLVVRAELAAARVPAFSLRNVQPRAVRIGGLLCFADGQAAKFVRMDDHCFVTLHKPMNFAEANGFALRFSHGAGRIDERAMGNDPEWAGALSFRLMSALAVDDLVATLIRLHRKPLFDAQRGSAPDSSMKAIMPEAGEFIPAPGSDRRHAALEIEALVAYSRACRFDDEAIGVLEDALWRALVHLGERSRKALGIRAALVKLYRAHLEKLAVQHRFGVRRLRERGGSVVDLLVQGRERLIKNLRALGRDKQALIEQDKLAQMLPAQKDDAIRQLNCLVAEVRGMLADTTTPGGAAFLQDSINSVAYAILHLSDVCEKMGNTEQSQALRIDGWADARHLAVWPQIAEHMKVALTASKLSDAEAMLLDMRMAERRSRRRRQAMHASRINESLVGAG